MLKINIFDDTEHEMTTDVESLFASIKVEDTKTNRDIMLDIDSATYLNCEYFIDRLGCKLPIMYLSTGCKAALLVANTDIDIDVRECGHNAISAILQNCNTGTISLIDLDTPFMYDSRKKDLPIDVDLDGYRFTDIRRLNHYIIYECGEEPDLNTEHIEKIKA